MARTDKGVVLGQRHSPTGPSHFELLANNPDLSEVVKIIRKSATSDACVLILGESGTGKELVARAIHELSLRRDESMVCLNLAAVPMELAETALFGHIQGAFTGAHREARGYCRSADKGTLFLDEIGEMNIGLQAKILRFLQNREVRPVGSEEVIFVDVRVISATNLDLELAIREKRFRDDLFHRLNIVQILIPPLRERPRDFPRLVDLFFSELNAKYERQCRLTSSAYQLLQAFDWPGNVRQLRAVIERLMILSEADIIGVSDLPVEIQAGGNRELSVGKAASTVEAATKLEQITNRFILDVLEQEGGNVALAARRLGIARATLYRRLKLARSTDDDALTTE